MAELSCHKVNKSFGNVEVIRDVSFKAEDGELIVIVGPSGCGKSTLLRIIAGLETLSSGEVCLDAKNINKLEPKQRNMAMVFQNYALYPHMSVYHNMAYGLRMRGMPKAEIQKRVEDVADNLGLSQVLYRRPYQLSGGQRQRVAMGRAMVREPEVFLFDEPLSNLDARRRVQTRLEIKRLQTKLKTTSLYVTHDQVEAMTLADRLIVMNQGHVEQIGAPIEVYENPKTKFVAGFIGSPAMNIMKAMVNPEKTGLVLPNGHFIQITLPEGAKPSQQLYFGIRPEHLHLSPEKKTATIKINVIHVEPLGPDTLVHGFLENSEEEITARVPSHWRANMGDTIPLWFSDDECHYFDIQSGERL